jgi:glycosyltransferase involved in cell wall biosynthesis
VSLRWAVVSPYFETPDDRWISHSAESDRHRFDLIPSLGADRNWHQSSATAGFGEWVNRVRQARSAFAEPDSGVITVFPQLAAAAGVWKMVDRRHRPLVAWLFNTEGLNSKLKRSIARVPLGRVDRFVVHSTAEIAGYAELLNLPEERFEYVPLQYGGEVETAEPEGQSEPYIFATGSGYRDYETFFTAVGKLGYRTLVLASDRVLEGLTVPSNVEILEQISRPAIRRLVRHARVNVVPLNDQALTAGLVTIVETYRHGRSLVTTERRGLEDYCVHDKNALCAQLFDPKSMAEAIDSMWSDDSLRSELDANASRFADENCTDAAAARHLYRVLDSTIA